MYTLPKGLEFERVLGRGATGTVVLARQTALGRRVAVKIIPTHASKGTIERLRREAKVLSALDHRNILPVYQLHQDDTTVALVMKYEPWGDLKSALPYLGGSQRVAVLADIAAGLEAAHSRGIVHRDLKPANILSDEYGRAVLADFGLARLPRDTSGYRTEGLVVTGTPLYLAPEQIIAPQVESPTLDHYAFGIVAYQLLLDRWPYAAPTWSTVNDLHLKAEPVHPRVARPDLDPEVAALLLALLEKDPRRRPTATEVAQRLTALSPDTWDSLIPAATRPAPPDESLIRTTRREVVGETVGTAFGWSADADVNAADAATAGEADLPMRHAQAPPDRTIREWVAPSVYAPPRQLPTTVKIAALVVLGVILGLLGYLWWLRS